VAGAKASDDIAAIGPVDIVLFCVKSWDTPPAAAAIRPLVGGDTAVISLQNGVDNEDEMIDVLGREPVVGGLAYVTSFITAPGRFEQSGAIARIIFGELDGRRSQRLEACLQACLAAKIQADLTDDIAKAIWTKFLYICAFSGVCTVTRQPLGPVLQDQDTRRLFEATMQEVTDLAIARGVAVDPDIVARQMKLADTFGPTLKPSMLVDLERGNRLEVQWLNGAVSRLAKQTGVPTPVNDFIYAALKLLADPAQ
jgi:2-dehydropantoate 2-reductase